MEGKCTCVTLEHKSSVQSLGIFVEIAKNLNYTSLIIHFHRVKIIHFSFMPKIIRILNKDHVP